MDGDGWSRRGRFTDGQNKIAKVETGDPPRGGENKEKGSSGFIRVKIISTPESLNKYRGKLNAASAGKER